jgi:succinate dehydrogenase/fumarate reductase-like Fe-S protein
MERKAMGEEGSAVPSVDIFVNGKRFGVPGDLTIVDAMEHAGFKFVRGSGCRQGMCGACAILYRLSDSYKLMAALACQELVRDGMRILMVPYSPAKKAVYDLNQLRPSENVLIEHFPEIARCLSCNTCTKACPQELEVMQFVQASVRGDFEEISRLSFDCIECGLCAVRCPAEIVPYFVARLARRIYGRYIVGLSALVEKRRGEIEDGAYDEELDEISRMEPQQVRELYRERDFA